MRSFKEMLNALKVARDDADCAAHRVGEGYFGPAREALVRSAQLSDALDYLTALEHGQGYYSPEQDAFSAPWIITPSTGGGWIGDKPGLDLDDHHPVWLNQKEVRDWIDEFEAGAAEANHEEAAK